MIRRTYECEDCKTVYEVDCSPDDPDFPCPECSIVMQWRPQRLNIGGSNESKAVNYAQKVMEEDYGLTNYKDNAVAGESGAIMPSQTTVEREKMEREAREMVAQTTSDNVKSFWGGNQGATPQVNSVTGQSLIANAKVGPAGVDPMAMLHQGVKSGKVPTPQQMTRVIASADMQGRRTR